MANMILIKAPHDGKYEKYPSLFLAGSIENGTAVDWQTSLSQILSKEKVVVYNPRRDDWDWTWEQRIDNFLFYEQVNWELDHLEEADIISMYFDPNTKAPISLLEFGLFARTGKLIVCCPEGFWRKGNVDIVCERFNIPLYDNMKDFSLALIEKIRTIKKL